MKIKLYILSSNEEVRTEVEQSLNHLDYFQLIGSTAEIEQVDQVLNQEKIDVLLVSPEEERKYYDFIAQITPKYPLTQVILLENQLSEETLHDALYLGVKDVLIKPYDPKKFVESVARVQKLAEKRKAIVTPRSSLEKEKYLGKILTFFSTKGGVGKTFTAINFATSLAANTDKRVVLVDLDLDYGNSALALNLAPKYTILDVVNDMHNIDKDLIESYLLPHESELKVLASNVQFELKNLIEEEQVRIIIELLQQSFDYVVVDMPGRFRESSMPALALADELMVIITPELSTVRNVQSLLNSLEELSYPAYKIHLVLNKYDKKGDIGLDDISKTLNQEINQTIGVDYKRVPSSLNKGVPFVTEHPSNAISMDIMALVEEVTGEEIVNKKGLFGFRRN